MEYKKLSHSIYLCDYHIVFVTKYRRKIINDGIFEYMSLKLRNISEYYPQIEIKEVNNDKDHVHFLISIPPTMKVGDVVRIIKSNTARELKQKFQFLKQVYWGTDSIWSSGYFVSTVGINDKVIREYIRRQGEEDSGQAKLEL